jgi:hypothetical protein
LFFLDLPGSAGVSEQEVHVACRGVAVDDLTDDVIIKLLTNPVYTGAYAYGKSRHQRYIDEQGMLRRRTRYLPMAEWSVLLPEHHPGFIDWAMFQANQARIDTNIHPQPHQAARQQPV